MKTKILFLLLTLPYFLFANLNYPSNSSKRDVAILNSFDVADSFIYDPILTQMRDSLKKKYKKKHFFQAMDDAYIFIPAIKNILTQYKIPKTFLYLAMAESNFQNTAYSNKRAAGLWQFMPSTARLYGLKIDDYVDERRDPIKSTRAAAKHLNDLYKRFGKWYLAAIAYNCGGGRLSRAIKKAKTDDLSILLDTKKHYIPRESRLYIRKILALALLANDEQFLIQSEYSYILNRANAYSMATVRLPKGESLKYVSSQVGIPLSTIKKLNRQLKYNFIPPYKNGYDIYIPYVTLSEFKQKYKPSPARNVYVVYRVKRGDTLSSIGKRYGVRYKIIMDFNNLHTTRLKLHQKLIIPVEKYKRYKKHYRHYYHNYYTVKKGDTLESISKRYKVSIAYLKTQNNLKSSFIKIGEKLKVHE